MSDRWPPVYPVDDLHRCSGCELLIPVGKEWCDACIYATETVEDSLAMYTANGMTVMQALIATLRDVYEQRRIADNDADRLTRGSDWLPCTDDPEDIPF